MRRSDVDRLFRALLPAATVAWVGCAVGCTDKSGKRDVRESGAVRDSAGEAKQTKPEGAGVGDGRVEELPSCPSGDWCGPQKAARKLAQEGHPDAHGCPKALRGGQEHAELVDDPVYEGLEPHIGELSAYLDEIDTKAKREAGDDDTCCYDWVLECPGGRPLLDADRQPVTARWRRGSAWATDPLQLTVPPDVQTMAATAWLEDAAMEHASVASFARATLELLAVGAPPELLAGCQRAGLDEIEHAQVCAAIARACGGGEFEPGPLQAPPPRAADLRRLAVDTFVEGCVGETTAALVVQRAAAACPAPALRDHLARIAAQEADHAALAWRIVRWAIGAGGPEILDGLQDAAADLDARMTHGPAPRPSPWADQLAAVGRLDPVALHEAKRDAWRHVVQPLLARVRGERSRVVGHAHRQPTRPTVTSRRVSSGRPAAR